MFFQKNLPLWERALRVGAGALTAAAGFYFADSPMTGWIVAAGGGMFALTGFIGFCPMCAMVGRKP